MKRSVLENIKLQVEPKDLIQRIISVVNGGIENYY